MLFITHYYRSVSSERQYFVQNVIQGYMGQSIQEWTK